VDQREVGLDTLSYANALRNTMREAPDVLMIGEIRDQETMRQALIYTQTGHLCLATLHANNAYHAMNRIISLFPAEMQEGLLLDLAMSLKAVISQRLVKGVDGKRVAAMEILVNNLHIAELIQRREIDKIKEAIEQSLVEGSQTFEESLLELHLAGRISKEEALLNSDSRTNMEWLIANSGKFKEQRAQRKREFQIEDKVAEDKEDNFPGLLSVDDLDKLGVAGLSLGK
jgi:twitching motility protein PilU